MKVALYVRVSTEEQAREGYSIKAQIQNLKDYSRIQGWEVFDIYKDDGYSAKDLNRPDMQRLIRDAKNKMFDIVLVYRLDRLVRSVLNLHELLSLFDEYNVKFRSATEVFDTTSAMGRFFITLVAAMAEWERENLAERVKFGLNRKALEGKRPSSSAPFGYDLVDKKLVVNKEEAEIVKYIFKEIRKKGRHTIAKELNKKGIRTKKGGLWSEASIQVITTNPIYTGYFRWNHRSDDEEIILKGDHEAIISKEEFDEIQELVNSRKQKGFKGNSEYVFSSLLKCARCGTALAGSRMIRNGQEIKFYRCVNKVKYKNCDLPNIRQELIEEKFLDLIDLPIEELPIPQNDDLDTKKVNEQIKRIEKRMSRLKELYLEGDLDKEEYRKRMDKEKQEYHEKKKLLKKQTLTLSIEEIEKFMRNIKKEWKYFSDSGKKDCVNFIVEYISIDVKKVAKHRFEKTEITITDFKMK